MKNLRYLHADYRYRIGTVLLDRYRTTGNTYDHGFVDPPAREFANDA